MTIIINSYALEEREEALESELLVVIIINKKNLQLNCFKCFLLQFNFQYVAYIERFIELLCTFMRYVVCLLV